MCSTSPEVEPPGFCVQLRAVLARMLANPRPLDTLFPGARPRTYTRHPATGEWRLELQTMVREDFTITEKAHTRDFSRSQALRIYANQPACVLCPLCLK